MEQMNLGHEASKWVDTEEYNGDIVRRFTEYVNADAELKAHRDFVEKHVYGFGERAFHWAWKLLVDEMPQSFRFLEIGVWKGQALSVMRLLANRTTRDAYILGVTRLDSFSGPTGVFPKFPDDDYANHIKSLHDHFEQEQPHIYVGDSTDEKTHQDIEAMELFDIVYLDGCHEYAYVANDLKFYSQRVKPGGFLVIDDSANFLQQPYGFFQGIQDVSRATREIIEPDPDYKHLLACMHLRVFRKLR